MSRKTLPKISKVSLRGGSGFKNSQDFTNVLFTGNHPDERSNEYWIYMMKQKGFKNIDKGMY